MNWNSMTEFWAMGGYGLYVWGSFGLCVVVMLVEPFMARARHKSITLTLQRQLRAEKLEQDRT